MILKEFVFTLNELENIVPAVWEIINNNKILAFYGEMGVGKTTFIKQLCKHLGVINDVISPTYSIINEYDFNNHKIYHLDLFRLKNEDEIFEIGLTEILNSNNYCFIEWPEKAEFLFPSQKINLYFSMDIENLNRTLKIII